MAKMAKKCVRPSKMTKIATFWTTFWTPILTFSKNTVKSSNISHTIWVTSRVLTKRSSKVVQKRLFHVFVIFKNTFFWLTFWPLFWTLFYTNHRLLPRFIETKKWQKSDKKRQKPGFSENDKKRKNGKTIKSWRPLFQKVKNDKTWKSPKFLRAFVYFFAKMDIFNKKNHFFDNKNPKKWLFVVKKHTFWHEKNENSGQN